MPTVECTSCQLVYDLVVTPVELIGKPFSTKILAIGCSARPETNPCSRGIRFFLPQVLLGNAAQVNRTRVERSDTSDSVS